MKRSSFQKPLSKTRAQEILNAYGADPERWPEDERQSLIQLLAQSPELQALRETGAHLDGLLDEWQPKLSCSIDTLISSLPAQPQRKQNWSDQLAAFFFPGYMAWRQAMLAGIPLMLGFIWGLSGEPPADDWTETEFLIFNPPLEVITDE